MNNRPDSSRQPTRGRPRSSPVVPIARTRNTNGCLACRLRGKKCVRLQAGETCSECSHLFLVCYPRTGRIPTAMRSHPACQEAGDEIREAINTVRGRIFDHPLPATQRFAELLNNTTSSRDNVPVSEPRRHRSVPSHQVALNDDASHLTLFPNQTNLPFDSRLPFAPHLYGPVVPQEDAPDYVLYPRQSPISTNVLNYGPGVGPNPSMPLILPIPSYHHQAALGGSDLETFIEDLRPVFRRHGYEIIPSPGWGL